VFASLDMTHQKPDLVWNVMTKQELCDVLAVEITDYHVMKVCVLIYISALSGVLHADLMAVL